MLNQVQLYEPIERKKESDCGHASVGTAVATHSAGKDTMSVPSGVG